jgi:hypothetical protein
MRVAFLVGVFVIFSFLFGCESEALRPAPTEKVVYTPKSFEDYRVKVNPWRNDDDPANTKDPGIYIPSGPAYPYRLVYNPDTGNYEVVLREGAPVIEGRGVEYSRSAAPYTIEVPKRE